MRLICIVFILFSSLSYGNSEYFTLSSKFIDEDVAIQISLPESYRHSESFAYPVLVALDGSTQFEHIAANVKFLSSYAIIPEMIVIGVSTQDRLKYLTYTEPKKFKKRSGQANAYTKFLRDELLVSLDKKYRIAPYRIISGHSLSGLYTSYLAMNNGLGFNAEISISPSLWWDNNALVKDFQRFKSIERRRPNKWFLSMASEPGMMKDAFDAMVASLNEEPVKNLNWFQYRFPKETHDSTPLLGNVQALRAIFKGWNAVPEVDVMPLKELEAHYRDKSLEYGYRFPMSAQQFNVYGLKASYEGKTKWGVEILEKGVEDFEGSEVLWDGLATAYSRNDELVKAVEASERALELAEQHESVFLNEIIAQNSSLKAKLANNSIRQSANASAD